MALIGGGGSPNVSGGANPAGTGSSINYIGKHAYANSGTFEATTSAQTVLQFTTASGYIVGTLQLNSAIQFSNVSVRQSAARISFDGQIVAILSAGDANEDAPLSQATEILLPPYTNVKVEVISSSGDSDNFVTVGIVGEVYN